MAKKSLTIASDHRGFALKTLFVARLKEMGHEVVDLGPTDETRCDAGDFAQKVAADLRAHPEKFGILICGSGQAMAMTSNRYKHIRAALCTDSTMVKLACTHNNANVLALGADIIGKEVALDCLEVFVSTEFLGGRYAERCDKLTNLGGI